MVSKVTLNKLSKWMFARTYNELNEDEKLEVKDAVRQYSKFKYEKMKKELFPLYGTVTSGKF